MCFDDDIEHTDDCRPIKKRRKTLPGNLTWSFGNGMEYFLNLLYLEFILNLANCFYLGHSFWFWRFFLYLAFILNLVKWYFSTWYQIKNGNLYFEPIWKQLFCNRVMGCCNCRQNMGRGGHFSNMTLAFDRTSFYHIAILVFLHTFWSSSCPVV